jgi:hypothetical protein
VPRRWHPWQPWAQPTFFGAVKSYYVLIQRRSVLSVGYTYPSDTFSTENSDNSYFQSTQTTARLSLCISRAPEQPAGVFGGLLLEAFTDKPDLLRGGGYFPANACIFVRKTANIPLEPPLSGVKIGGINCPRSFCFEESQRLCTMSEDGVRRDSVFVRCDFRAGSESSAQKITNKRPDRLK